MKPHLDQLIQQLEHIAQQLKALEVTLILVGSKAPPQPRVNCHEQTATIGCFQPQDTETESNPDLPTDCATDLATPVNSPELLDRLFHSDSHQTCCQTCFLS